MSNHIKYPVNGFLIQMTARRKWTAYRFRQNGTLIDELPITWTRDTQMAGGKIWQKIYFPKNKVEEGKLISHFWSSHPFLAVIAEAKDWKVRPLELARFVHIFEVRSARRMLSPRTLKVEVVRQNVSSLEPEPRS
jgi:hypothetical protein